MIDSADALQLREPFSNPCVGADCRVSENAAEVQELQDQTESIQNEPISDLDQRSASQK